MFIDVDVIPLIPCIDAGLFIDAGMVGIDFGFIVASPCGEPITDGYTAADIRLLAIIVGFILQTFDIHVVGIDFNTFTFYLAPNKVCITTALYCGLAVGVTHMACHISGFITVAVTFAVIAPNSNPRCNAIAHFYRHPRIKAARFIGAALFVRLFGSSDVDVVLCPQEGSLFTGHIRTVNGDVGCFACPCGNNIYFASGIHLRFGRGFSFSMRT